MYSKTTEAEFLDEIQTKVFTAFLLAIHSHFCFAFTLTQPLIVSRVQLLYTVKEKGGKPDRKPNHTPFPMV
jgi:hypothetical protein